MLRFYGYGFLPTVLEAVLEAAQQKMNAVPYLNRSPFFFGYGFYNYDIINAPVSYRLSSRGNHFKKVATLFIKNYKDVKKTAGFSSSLQHPIALLNILEQFLNSDTV